MLIQIENDLWKKGIYNIAGVDEVGRGCLAGPMVIGAVILNPNHLRNNDVLSQEIVNFYEQINDSKLLSEKRRELLSQFIIHNALSYSIVEISSNQIDEWGISKSTQVGFFNAVNNLKFQYDHIFTDSFEIRAISQDKQTSIIKGDTKSINIAAASIIAKVYRDKYMTELHNNSDEYKVYAFNKNKGYGTKRHLDSIRQHGISNLHRKSFKPCYSSISL